METFYDVIINKMRSMFESFNDEFFNSELVVPAVSISFVTDDDIEIKPDEENRTESDYVLTLSSHSFFNTLDEIAIELLHQMVHMYNMMHGIRDTYCRELKHNNKFASKAREVGLIVENNKNFGFEIVDVSDQLNTYIENLRWESIKG